MQSEIYFNKEAKQWDSNAYRVERARVIAEAIKKDTQLQTGYTGLDFGCGTGLLGFNFIEDSAHFMFIDTSEGMIEQVRNKIEESSHNADALAADLTKNPVERSFDLIVTLQALHHIEQYKTILDILSSLLTDRGYLCIADLLAEDGSFHNGETVEHRGFDAAQIESYLTASGLEKISTSIPFKNKKVIDGTEKEFPVFLTIFQKPGR